MLPSDDDIPDLTDLADLDIWETVCMAYGPTPVAMCRCESCRALRIQRVTAFAALYESRPPVTSDVRELAASDAETPTKRSKIKRA